MFYLAVGQHRKQVSGNLATVAHAQKMAECIEVFPVLACTALAGNGRPSDA